ncbi:hypothetical protein A6X21_02695 [Planctopirus hydrillae]|uniref:Uncharacterized protein n=1 Tax=Planctopirus hydrillae TaxID=1841610 RepID=A0A1C3EN04_9PLAN|nr:hypothetical protein A6X21_02695 [Planctopirus hydrillae]
MVTDSSLSISKGTDGCRAGPQTQQTSVQTLPINLTTSSLLNSQRVISTRTHTWRRINLVSLWSAHALIMFLDEFESLRSSPEFLLKLFCGTETRSSQATSHIHE